ncbi:MAG: DUF2188 domain-containing protein [Bacteroidales bacterium]|nr:DUF2188 domain-containing protein [Bacteroidales bacterium]MDD4770727.1 DUF2188 domain-containing protein [Bacteroidales bacterium]
MGKTQHVVPRGNQWGVKGEGNSKCSSLSNTQQQATQKARGIAINNHSEVVIHRPDGRIRDKNSYGNDPYPPKG